MIIVYFGPSDRYGVLPLLGPRTTREMAQARILVPRPLQTLRVAMTLSGQTRHHCSDGSKLHCSRPAAPESS